MAKARADGTPAKASGKKKATTPATKAKAKSESPERRVTRSSPKEEAAAAATEKVQAGRVTKKTAPVKAKASPAKTKASPAKAKASPAKAKASPAKAKAQTPPKTKAASPTSAKAAKAAKATKVTKAANPKPKASPAKTTKAKTPPGTKAASPAASGGKKSTKKATASPAKAPKSMWPKNKFAATPTRRTVSQVLAGPPKKGRGRTASRRDDDDGTLSYTIEDLESQLPEEWADEMVDWVEHKLNAPELHDEQLEQCYHLLVVGFDMLREHDEQGHNVAQVQRLRPVCHRLWTTFRRIVGSALDECLDENIHPQTFRVALVSGQGPRKRFWSREEGKYHHGWVVEDIVPLDYEDVLLEHAELKRLFDEKHSHSAAQRAPSTAGKSASPAKRAGSVSRKSASPAKRTKSHSPTPAPAPVPAAAAAPPPPPPSERSRSKSPAKRATSPKKASSNAGSEGSIPGYTHQNARGAIVSPTNPPDISALNKRNPFHETLPAPEVWHRKMPPYFSFGETPYMQQLVSQQIQEDLDRNTNERTKTAQAKEGWLKKATGMLGSLGDMLSGSPAKQARGYPSPWDLPHVSDDELDSELGLVKPSSRRRSSASRGSISRKPMSPKKPTSPKKMPPRETEDEDASDDDGDYMMAGGLH